jgi:hypothetical protein
MSSGKAAGKGAQRPRARGRANESCRDVYAAFAAVRCCWGLIPRSRLKAVLSAKGLP